MVGSSRDYMGYDNMVYRIIHSIKIPNSLLLSIYLTVIVTCGIYIKTTMTGDMTLTHRNLILGIGNSQYHWGRLSKGQQRATHSRYAGTRTQS